MVKNGCKEMKILQKFSCVTDMILMLKIIIHSKSMVANTWISGMGDGNIVD